MPSSSSVTLNPVSASACAIARASFTGFLSGECLYALLPITSATRLSPPGAGFAAASVCTRSAQA
ncbi:MAG: hypothetical protein AB7Q97_26120 [Gammaproteobacteria bacterium]